MFEIIFWGSLKVSTFFFWGGGVCLLGHRKLAWSFNLCYKYIDDLIVFNNKMFIDICQRYLPI